MHEFIRTGTTETTTTAICHYFTCKRCGMREQVAFGRDEAFTLAEALYILGAIDKVAPCKA